MTGNAKRIMRRELIPGRNYDDDIDAIRAQVRGLDIDAPDYDERHAALMTELRRLRDLDTTPDRWELRPTRETWGGRWTGPSRAPLSAARGWPSTGSGSFAAKADGRGSSTR